MTTYILTADLDDASFKWLNDLRRRHFPSERNFLPAHLTLFHRLSPSQISRLGSFEAPSEPLAVRFDSIMSLGSGVAVHVQSAELTMLRSGLRTALEGEFTRQDNQPWKSHVTIQNKVAGEIARELKRSLATGFSGRDGAITGLLVWEYLGGPWRLVDRLALSPELKPLDPF